MNRLLISTATALLFSAATASAFNDPIYAPGDQFSGLAHATDGDTIRLGNDVRPARIRVFGIDAPESSQSCERNGETYACGSEATAYLRNLIDGQTVNCTAKAIDRYHRTVASCSINGVDIGAEMIKSGHAVEFRRYTSIYDGEEQIARNAKRGLWAGAFTDPSEYRRAKRAGSF
jgi:endonuclease YncB( thermonuclease family)